MGKKKNKKKKKKNLNDWSYRGFTLVGLKGTPYWQVRWYVVDLVPDYSKEPTDCCDTYPTKKEVKFTIIKDFVPSFDEAKKTVDEFLNCPRWIKSKYGYCERNDELDYRDIMLKYKEGKIDKDTLEVELTGLLLNRG